mgnify:CR=1 FL=1
MYGYDAMLFAESRHKGQVRKYTGDPYIVHLAEVVGIVASVQHTSAMLSAAWLHDTLEDTDTTFDELATRFGGEAAALVWSLTDQYVNPEYGNRAARKKAEADRLEHVSSQAKTIKLADMISNTRSIVTHDHSFARTYLREKAYLLEKLKAGDAMLWAKAYGMVMDGVRSLKISL